ncbi:fam-a protein [Plasmodium vinckei brucechwatti]|uniref:Fam-a protein n=1 Tax=Plasmodium vinckei brucechwatti TaxID=119398 RepID=A0A6V7SSH9_PLAVN|nr:fam-a protein [Plasmodium vinckei brucechwatti]
MFKMSKIYVQIAFFLLSIFVYVDNKTLAANPDPRKVKRHPPPSYYHTSEQIFGKNVHLLCHDREETKNADKVMEEAIEHLKHYAINADGYKTNGNGLEHNMFYFKKKCKVNNVTVDKIIYTVDDPDMYESTIHQLWDPDIINLIDNIDTKTKIVRVYSMNLVMIQQLYKNWQGGHEKYFYALATKVQLSKDTAIIAMTSANIIDHHPSDKEYKNKIVKKANLFTTEIDSEDDIRNGKLKKTYAHLAGYYIQKHNDHVNVTYISSTDGRTLF